MKISQRIALLVAISLAGISTALAVDVTGKWTSEFESQVGHLKYVFTLKQDGGVITGKAHRESEMSKVDDDLKDGKIDGDNISFGETFHVQDGSAITIQYTGKVASDEMTLSRKAGDFGAKDIVAKREKADSTVSIAGKWRAEFDTQIGPQKYLFTLTADGDTVKGKANAEIGEQKFETELAEGKISGSEVTFVENMDFAGQTVHIGYKGVINGDQIKFTRKVGDIATEEFTANREK